jgi:hypothetical protein
LIEHVHGQYWKVQVTVHAPTHRRKQNLTFKHGNGDILNLESFFFLGNVSLFEQVSVFKLTFGFQNIVISVQDDNSFIFNDKHFLQIQVTAMGTETAPSYANLFIGK